MPAHLLSIAIITASSMRHTLSVREKESYSLMQPTVEIHPLAKILRRLPPQVFFSNGLLLRLIFLCDVLLPSSYSTCLYQTRTTCSVEKYNKSVCKNVHAFVLKFSLNSEETNTCSFCPYSL